MRCQGYFFKNRCGGEVGIYLLKIKKIIMVSCTEYCKDQNIKITIDSKFIVSPIEKLKKHFQS